MTNYCVQQEKLHFLVYLSHDKHHNLLVDFLHMIHQGYSHFLWDFLKFPWKLHRIFSQFLHILMNHAHEIVTFKNGEGEMMCALPCAHAQQAVKWSVLVSILYAYIEHKQFVQKHFRYTLFATVKHSNKVEREVCCVCAFRCVCTCS